MDLSTDKRIEWDIGTAYDFFVSLWALHEPGRLGLRGSWAAGVRSRLSGPDREILQRAMPLVRPMRWTYSLPAPKNAQTALDELRAMDPEARLLALMPETPPQITAIWRDLAARGSWNEEDQMHLMEEMSGGDWKKHSVTAVRKAAAEYLDLWIDPIGAADSLLAAYQCYYDVFFAEEEPRIRPALEEGLAHAQMMAEQIQQWDKLLEELSQGLRVTKDWENKTLVLAPSYWGTPLAIMADIDPDRVLFVFGARPSKESLIPGDVVPDALHQALKALADPTRLRILRYLTDEPLAPVELARRLRLRSPTVIHHLDALRLARLVIVTIEPEGKRYAVRPDAVADVFSLLNNFLVGRDV